MQVSPLSCMGLLALLAAPLAANEQTNVLPQANANFENGLMGWVINEDPPMSTAHPEAAYSGELGLRIIDNSESEGSSIATRRFAVEPDCAYRLSVWARLVSGGGAGIYLRFFNEKGKQLNPWPKASDNLSINSTRWRQYTLEASPPEGAATVEAWFRTYAGSTCVIDFDDLVLERFVPQIAPPWKPAYKLSPEDTRLTAADVPGPDGIVYPDWRMVGIQGGIPDVPTVVGPERFDGLEGTDIAPLVNTLLSEVAAQGGGAVELPAGKFLLDSPIVIRDSNVVLRGAGRDATHLLYQEHIPYGEIRAQCWTPSGVIGPDGFFEVQANPKNLVGLRLSSGDTLLQEQKRRAHWGNRFFARIRGRSVLELIGPGTHPLKAEITYANGDRFTQTFEMTVSEVQQPDDTWVDMHGAIMLVGGGFSGPEIRLAVDGKRGQSELVLTPDHGLEEGERIMLLAPATDRWNAITGNVTPWGTFRINEYEVVAVDGDRVTINQPLRIDFPVVDGSFVQRIGTVESSGVEGLTVEQKVFTTELVGPRIQDTLWYPMEDLWANGVTFSHGWGCWARDVRIINSGRNPLYLTRSKFCELRDIDVQGAIFKGGGGTGYVGFERSFDCLMDGVTTYGMRHAPNVQWGSAGNVIRNGTFIGSDGQWHAGWTHENLYENNTIVQSREDVGQGTYGHAFFASGPASASHGPQGPRNVVYYNDAIAIRDGLHMVGGNEAWIVVYNRIVCMDGRAIYGREKSFEHTIFGNYFGMEKPKDFAILFDKADCTGVEIVDNRFYGPIKEIVGFGGNIGQAGLVQGNEILPLPEGGLEAVPRPNPTVKSIFEWQRSDAAPASALQL